MPHKRAKHSVRVAEKAARGYNLAPSSSTSRDIDDTPRSASRLFNAFTSRAAFKASGRISSEDTGEMRKKRKRNDADDAGTSGLGAGQSSSSKLVTNSQVGESSGSNSSNSKGKGKGKGKEGEGEGSVPKIRDNESLAEYNRRVEAALRPGVSQAIKSASAIKAAQEKEYREAKKARKAEAAAKFKASRMKTETDHSDEGEDGEGGDVLDESQRGKGERRGTGKEKVKAKSKAAPTGAKHDISDPAKEFQSAPAPRRLNDIVQAPPALPHLKAAKRDAGKKKSVWTTTGRTPLSMAQERLLNDERERVVKAYREIKAGREEKREKERMKAD